MQCTHTHTYRHSFTRSEATKENTDWSRDRRRREVRGRSNAALVLWADEGGKRVWAHSVGARSLFFPQQEKNVWRREIHQSVANDETRNTENVYTASESVWAQATGIKRLRERNAKESEREREREKILSCNYSNNKSSNSKLLVKRLRGRRQKWGIRKPNNMNTLANSVALSDSFLAHTKTERSKRIYVCVRTKIKRHEATKREKDRNREAATFLSTLISVSFTIKIPALGIN